MMSHRLVGSVATLAFVPLASPGACEKGPPETVGTDPQGNNNAPAKGGAGVSIPATPVSAPIELKLAVEGLPGQGALLADLGTEAGKLTCKLYEDKAPKAVANFVALARGLQPFKDPITGTWVK